MITAANKIGEEIADALGLKHCKMINIHLEKGQIVTVEAMFYPEIDGVMQAATILKKYELQEIEEQKGNYDQETV